MRKPPSSGPTAAAMAAYGALAGIGTAFGLIVGGVLTTALSWRVGFALEAVVIAVVLLNLRLIKDVPYTGSRKVDSVGAVLSAVGMGGVIIGILVWQEGGEYVGALIAIGAIVRPVCIALYSSTIWR